MSLNDKARFVNEAANVIIRMAAEFIRVSNAFVSLGVRSLRSALAWAVSKKRSPGRREGIGPCECRPAYRVRIRSIVACEFRQSTE